MTDVIALRKDRVCFARFISSDEVCQFWGTPNPAPVITWSANFIVSAIGLHSKRKFQPEKRGVRRQREERAEMKG